MIHSNFLFRFMIIAVLALTCFAACKTGKLSSNQPRRFAIVEIIPWMTQEDTFKLETLYDTVYIFDEATVSGLKVAQFQLNRIEVTNGVKADLPVVLDYFVCEPAAATGLFFASYTNYEPKVAKTDSVMQLKIDKYKGLDTVKCLMDKPAVYKKGKDIVYSFAHTKTDEYYDYDSIKLVYTADRNLKNEYLSKAFNTRDGKFLYKILFYFKSTFEQKRKVFLPEREMEVKVYIDNNYNKSELEMILNKFKNK